MNTRRLEPCNADLARTLVEKFHGRVVSTEYMAKFLSNPSNFLLIAEGETEEGETELIGFLSAHRLDSLEQEAEAMFIYEIDVEARHRRQGAGAALITHIRRIADERQMFELFVLTNHFNEGAVAFYKATGGQVEEGDELMFVYPRTYVKG